MGVKLKDLSYGLLEGKPNTKPVQQFIVLSWPELLNYFFAIGLDGLIFGGLRDIFLGLEQGALFLAVLREYCESGLCGLGQLTVLARHFRQEGKAFENDNQDILSVLLDSLFQKLRMEELSFVHEFKDLKANVYMNEGNALRAWQLVAAFKYRHFFKKYVPDLAYYHLCTYNSTPETFLGACTAGFVRESGAPGLVAIGDMEIDCTDPLNYMGVLLKITVELQFKQDAGQVYYALLEKLFEHELFEMIDKLTALPVVYSLALDNFERDLEELAIRMLHEQIRIKPLPGKEGFFRQCLRYIKQEDKKVSERAFLELSLLLHPFGLDIRLECEKPCTPFLLRVIELCGAQVCSKDVYTHYKEIRSGRTQQSEDLDYIEFRIEYGYRLLAAKNYMGVLEVIEDFSATSDAIVEELEFGVLCAVVEDGCNTNERFILDERCKEFLLHKGIIGFKNKKVVALLREYLSTSSANRNQTVVEMIERHNK